MAEDSDQLLDPSYLADLDSAELGDVRRRLQRARDADDELSFVRRLIHGRLDILRAELARRQDERPDSERGQLVDRLTDILGKGPSGSRGARPRTRPPPDASPAIREFDRILGDAGLARLPDLALEEISSLVDRLVDEERKVSDQRRKVLDVVDTLEEELVRRFSSDPEAATRSIGRNEA